MKKKVHKLSEPVELPFSLIGVSCHESDYRLTWAINRKLGLSFEKKENHVIIHPKSGEKLEFSMFSHTDPEKYLKFNIISNRCHNGFLLEKIKNIDYLIQIIGDISDASINTLVSNIRKIDLISAAFPLTGDEKQKFSPLLPLE